MRALDASLAGVRSNLSHKDLFPYAKRKQTRLARKVSRRFSRDVVEAELEEYLDSPPPRRVPSQRATEHTVRRVPTCSLKSYLQARNANKTQ